MQCSTTGVSKNEFKLLSGPSSFSFFSIWGGLANYILSFHTQNKLTSQKVRIPRPAHSHFQDGTPPLFQPDRTPFSTRILSNLPKDGSSQTIQLMLVYIYTIPPCFEANSLLFQKKVVGAHFMVMSWRMNYDMN